MYWQHVPIGEVRLDFIGRSSSGSARLTMDDDSGILDIVVNNFNYGAL